MAKKIDQVLKTKWSTSSIYPWNEWCDGSAWEAVRGSDFNISCDQFQNNVHQTARRRGIKATTLIVDEDTVQFQFRKP